MRYLPLPWATFRFALALLLAGAVRAQDRIPPPPPMPPAGDAQELARGPIHEAFAQPTTFNPQAGPVAPKAPPDPVNELPPEQRPDGDRAAWIPGYWSWDDEQNGFVWVSGFWRVVPPGRTWVPGYWARAADGYQWVSGYWAPERASEAVYLPPPPESLEDGPNTEPGREGQVWIPGTWVWRTTRYWWRPGFWTTPNPDWVWVPAQYLWTPAGFVFVDGFWDYPLGARGVPFAPVRFAAIPAGFVYRPSVVLDVRNLPLALFVRPAYHSYFFGDYYAPAYARAGVYPWFAFHASRFGHDPLFAHLRSARSQGDPGWEQRVRQVYLDRRVTEAARPPHTIREYTGWARRQAGEARDAAAFARPLTEAQADRDFPTRMVNLPERQAATFLQEARHLREFQAERVRAEAAAARDVGTAPSARRTAPSRVTYPELPRLGTATRPAGTTVIRPPDGPRVPEVSPPTTAPGTRRGLPHPEDILRGSGPAVPVPKGRLSDPVPMPKGVVPPRPAPPVGPLPKGPVPRGPHRMDG